MYMDLKIKNIFSPKTTEKKSNITNLTNANSVIRPVSLSVNVSFVIRIRFEIKTKTLLFNKKYLKKV